MKYYSEHRQLQVYIKNTEPLKPNEKKKEPILCQFQYGEFETSDSDIIGQMNDHGENGVTFHGKKEQAKPAPKPAATKKTA